MLTLALPMLQARTDARHTDIKDHSKYKYKPKARLQTKNDYEVNDRVASQQYDSE